MNEMLANYHFLSRNYSFALAELENTFRDSPQNFGAKKRLIICYTQTGNLDKAIEVFLSVIREDISIIAGTELHEEDCPCRELVSSLETGKIRRTDEYEMCVELGILWLYCDVSTSESYFEKALSYNQSDSRIDQILAVIKKSKLN